MRPWEMGKTGMAHLRDGFTNPWWNSIYNLELLTLRVESSRTFCNWVKLNISINWTLFQNWRISADGATRRRDAVVNGHGRMARGRHGLPKVSPRPAMLDSSTPSGRATAETALLMFQGWPARKAGSLRLSSSPLDHPRRTPMRCHARRRILKTIEIQSLFTRTVKRKIASLHWFCVRAYVRACMCACAHACLHVSECT